MTTLKQRIELVRAERDWLNDMTTKHHYMHRPIHQKSHPFGWAVAFDGRLCQPDGKPSGFIIFASVHFTKLTGEFGYPGLPTKWQVLSLARLWLHDDLPRNSETCVMGKAHRLVQRRWLEVHPPPYPEQPYHVVKIITYCDTRFFDGTIYRAANYRESGRTVSQKRHKNTMGAGLDGAKLIRFVYDLKEPRWQFEETMGLPLLQVQA